MLLDCEVPTRRGDIFQEFRPCSVSARQPRQHPCRKHIDNFGVAALSRQVICESDRQNWHSIQMGKRQSAPERLVQPSQSSHITMHPDLVGSQAGKPLRWLRTLPTPRFIFCHLPELSEQAFSDCSGQTSVAHGPGQEEPSWTGASWCGRIASSENKSRLESGETNPVAIYENSIQAVNGITADGTL